MFGIVKKGGDGRDGFWLDDIVACDEEGYSRLRHTLARY